VSFGSRSSGKTGQLTNLNRAASDAPCVLDGSRKQNLYFWYALDGIITAQFVKKKRNIAEKQNRFWPKTEQSNFLYCKTADK
jgi:hypothetical protein